MKKTVKRLKLSKETLEVLAGPRLERANGASVGAGGTCWGPCETMDLSLCGICWTLVENCNSADICY